MELLVGSLSHRGKIKTELDKTPQGVSRPVQFWAEPLVYEASNHCQSGGD